MNPALLARSIAALRVVIGAAILARPELAVAWIGRVGTKPGTQVMARGLGARDVALGAGTLATGDGALGTWLLVALIADATDFAATLAAGRAVPLRGRVLAAATALSAVAGGAAAYAGLRG